MSTSESRGLLGKGRIARLGCIADGERHISARLRRYLRSLMNCSNSSSIYPSKSLTIILEKQMDD
ncbi:MAG TPA: hypothetical protein VLJ61_13495 [Pyrinomonadaceae bacterium]|nr:hypothetical protein [Pyrinomonadaceae bacterium]